MESVTQGVSVECLKKITFSLLPLSEKQEIVTWGRPTPNILIKATRAGRTKKYLRSFNQNWYEKIKWLCGCDTTNALFCFPCLLFGGDTVWTQNGFTNISKMKEKTEKHQNSRRHIANMISLSALSQPGQLKPTETVKNKKDENHRRDLMKIVDCLKFGGKFELALRHGQNEFFNKLENFACSFDAAFRNHALVIGSTSENLHNDLLQHMLEVYREEIISEIQESSYVSVITEDVSDISDKIQTIIVFRYELHGVVHERFWGLLNTETVRRDGLSNCLLKEVKKVLKKDWNKLIAQIYSGPGKYEWYNIQSLCCNAHFVHKFSADLDLTVKHMTGSVNSAKLFFANVESLDRFFKKSTTRTAVLHGHINGSVSIINSLNVCTVFRIRNKLLTCFQDLLLSKTTDKTLEAAARFISLLNNENFLFWLEIFNQIILHFALFYQGIQSVDVEKIPQTIYNFCSFINKICNSTSSKNFECQQVSNCICDEIRERFAFTGHLSAAKLFYRDNFERFNLQLPKHEIRETCQAFPDLIEDKLKMELTIFYSQKKFHSLGILNILNCLNNESLLDAFSETIKLLKILLTIPTSDEGFSTVKKVKSCIRDEVDEDRLNALCMVTVESEVLSQIKNFNERVVERYCSGRNLKFYFK